MDRRTLGWRTSHPWVTGGLRITRAALDEVERLARVGYAADEEVCGLLTGPSHDPLLCDGVTPIENIARSLHESDPVRHFHTARTFFAFYARTLERVMEVTEDAGRPAKVLYHSHLDGSAILSATDRAVLSRGIAPASAGAPARIGPGPDWPLAFLVASVVRGTDAAPSIDEHRLYVWGSEGFEGSTFEVL